MLLFSYEVNITAILTSNQLLPNGIDFQLSQQESRIRRELLGIVVTLNAVSDVLDACITKHEQRATRVRTAEATAGPTAICIVVHVELRPADCRYGRAVVGIIAARDAKRVCRTNFIEYAESKTGERISPGFDLPSSLAQGDHVAGAIRNVC